jgi:hypothetical protein
MTPLATELDAGDLEAHSRVVNLRIEDIEVRGGGNSATARAIDRCLTRNCTVCTDNSRNHVKNSAQRL